MEDKTTYKEETFVRSNWEDKELPMMKLTRLTSPEEAIFFGEVNIAIETPMGVQTQPLQFKIEKAEDVKYAFGAFKDAAKKAVEKYQKQLKEESRKASKKIVTPEAVPPKDLKGDGKLMDISDIKR